MNLGLKTSVAAGIAAGLMTMTACDQMDVAETIANPSSIADKPFARCIMTIPKFPEFPGGDDSLAVWMKENIKWPETANDSTCMGKVIIGFTIQLDGTPKDFKIIKSACPELDSTALESIKKMPKWEPAGPGLKEDVQYNVPITFRR